MEQMPTYRIYANRADDLPWSIDTGTQEDEVHALDITGCDVGMYTMTDFSVRTGDDKTPKWWIVIENVVLDMCGNIARFYGEDREA